MTNYYSPWPTTRTLQPWGGGGSKFSEPPPFGEFLALGYPLRRSRWGVGVSGSVLDSEGVWHSWNGSIITIITRLLIE